MIDVLNEVDGLLEDFYIVTPHFHQRFPKWNILLGVSFLVEGLIVAVHVVLFPKGNIIFIQQNQVSVSQIRELPSPSWQRFGNIFSLFIKRELTDFD